MMNCPRCNLALVMSDRQGIEIDYCPQCRGVWLDRGELDKVIQRSQAYERDYDRDDDDDDDDKKRYNRPPEHYRQQQPYPPPPLPYQGQPYPPQQGQYPPQGYYKKKKSFWSELFD